MIKTLNEAKEYMFDRIQKISGEPVDETEKAIVSTLLEENAANAKYFKDGKLCDPLKEFRHNNVTLIRLRVWNDPYSTDGKPSSR